MILSGPRVTALLAAGLLAGCAPSEEEAGFLARQALLTRQNTGIRELIAEAEQGTLVPTGRFLVGLDESVLAGLLASQLPLERPLGERFVVRLEKAEVSLRDKYGVITIEGNIHRRASPDRRTAVRIHGGLGAVTIDPTTDMLHIQIAIDHIELLEAGFLEGVIGRGGKKFLAERGRELLRDAIPAIQVPVVLAQRIRIPSIQEGGIELDSLAIPLNLSVERVLAAGGKLWVTVGAEVGQVTGAEGGLGVAVGKKPKAAPVPPSPTPAPANPGVPEPDTGKAGGK
jgi:hypothetical protein